MTITTIWVFRGFCLVPHPLIWNGLDSVCRWTCHFNNWLHVLLEIQRSDSRVVLYSFIFFHNGYFALPGPYPVDKW